MYCETFEDYWSDPLHRESGDFYFIFYVYYKYCECFGRNISHRGSGDSC